MYVMETTHMYLYHIYMLQNRNPKLQHITNSVYTSTMIIFPIPKSTSPVPGSNLLEPVCTSSVLSSMAEQPTRPLGLDRTGIIIIY